MPDALAAISLEHFTDVFAGRRDAGKMGCALDAGALLDVNDGFERPLSRRAARTKGDGAETRSQRDEFVDRDLQVMGRFLALRREKFEAVQ